MEKVSCAMLIMRCAGIVSYNPDIERLRTNLHATAQQVREVFVYENGSENAQAVQRLCRDEFTNVRVISDTQNRGIAFALNRLLAAAHDCGYPHILMLDQDSVPTEGMCDELERHLSGNVAMVSPFILDRNRMTMAQYREMHLPAIERLTHAAKSGAITSGTLNNVSAALAVGGFDDELFIDYVDFDFNERLLLNGYGIVKDNRACLIHEKGKSKHTAFKVPRRRSDGKIVWTPLFTLGYGPMRCYYQARNRVVYWRKYHRWTKLEGLVELPPLIVLSMFEPHRLAKLKAYCRGIRDGVRMPVKEYRK